MKQCPYDHPSLSWPVYKHPFFKNWIVLPSDLLPDFSVDSTTWLAGSRFGRLINNRGKQQSASELGYDFDQEAILKQNVRTMRKWVEGPTQAKKAVAMLQMSLDLSNAQEGIIHEIVRDSA